MRDDTCVARARSYGTLGECGARARRTRREFVRTRPRTHTAFTMVRAVFGARLALPGECGKLFLGGGSTMQRSRMARAIRACSSGRWAVAAAALVVAGACGDTEFNQVFPTAVAVTVVSATNNQTGVVGQALAQPVAVQVTDGAGNPVGNVVVTWTVLTGGGSVASATSTTDLNGNASVVWTLGSTIGTQTLGASIANGASTTITATGTASGVTGMNIVSGNNQVIAVGATSAPLVIHIADQF